MLQTRYLDAGPALPQASMDAAMATGRATEIMGNTIQAVGDTGLKIAQRVREAEEAATMSAYFASIDEEAGQFSNSLLTRTDPQQWPTDWKTKVDEFKQRGTGLNLSPVAKQKLDVEIQNWSTQRTIRMEALAATRTVDEAQATIITNLTQAAKRNEWDEVDRHKALLPGLGVMPSKMEELENDLASQRARQELSEDAQADFQGTLKRLEDPDFLKQPGNERLTQEDIEFVKQEAYQQQRFTIGAASDKFQDLTATGDIRNAADIDKHFPEGSLPPRVIESFKANLSERMKEGFKAKAASPEYREGVIAAVEYELQSLPLEIDKFPEKLVEIEELIHTLPTGPTKTRLMERAQNVRTGQIKEFDNAADIAREDFVNFYKDNFFGDIKTEKSVNAILDNGFLRNRNNLIADGYSEAQADTIMGKAVSKEDLKAAGYTTAQIEKLIEDFDKGNISTTKQADLFRVLRPKRAKESTLKGYEAEVVEAIASGQATLTRVDLDRLAPAERKLAKSLSEFETWINAHPDKINDDDAIDKKKFEIMDKHRVQEADTLFTAPPSSRRSTPAPSIDPSTSSLSPGQIDRGPKGASEMISATPVGNNIKDMVKHFEAGGEKAGFHAQAYDDGKQYSIGYGTKAKPGEVISKEEAERRLDAELSSHRQRVVKEAAKVGLDLAPHELDALTSFDFNTGSIAKLLAGGTRTKEQIAEKMLLYTKADGKHLRGLANRRAAEAELFRKGYTNS